MSTQPSPKQPQPPASGIYSDSDGRTLNTVMRVYTEYISKVSWLVSFILFIIIICVYHGCRHNMEICQYSYSYEYDNCNKYTFIL